MGVHDGHRQRLKERFLQTEGAELSDAELLELMLFYSNPRSDVNPLVNRLLDRFGSLSGVFSASVEDLTKVEGVGAHTALSIALHRSIEHRLQERCAEQMEYIRSLEEAEDYLAPRFYGAVRERLYFVGLDGMGRVLRCTLLSEGGLTSTSLDTSALCRETSACGASVVLLAHNHLNGIPEPSPEDAEATLLALRCLHHMGAALADHYILADGRATSIRSVRPELWRTPPI